MAIGTQVKHSSEFPVQKKVALLVSAAGFLISLINLFSYLGDFSAGEAILKPAVLLMFFTSFLTLISGLIDHPLFRFIQIFLALFTGTIAILDTYNSIHGLGLVLLGVFLAFKYGFFRQKAILKSIIILIYVFSLEMVSAHLDDREAGIMYGLDSVIYLTIFIVVSYIIYQDEITAYIMRNKEIEDELSVLEAERLQLAGRMELLDSRIAALTKPVDLDKMGLTAKEFEVLEALILYRETEHELADRLGMSFHTIKNHFRHIRDKLGVDRREDIIEMCRNNFI
ncbi:MAG: LuxR C-terminal-related transcriptional regulator [Spirochaetales bacterium]|uniref:LuxR C-terminal-related transcriptional regulator n=1 Tax=Candidatus Thalassospirochaeta sargassi TaxID=3119039 RepID=A0AAJ1MNW1_9SPIO|nr:LuxR C-terminal-related transcriptional regulator [Spirochaetales bacterium]